MARYAVTQNAYDISRFTQHTKPKSVRKNKFPSNHFQFSLSQITEHKVIPMDNVHNKRHLFEVYSSADEERDDVNELQDEYESESMFSEEKYPVFDLEEGDVFENWDFAEKRVESCAKNTGFEVKKTWLEKNKEGEIVHHTFSCKFIVHKREMTQKI